MLPSQTTFAVTCNVFNILCTIADYTGGNSYDNGVAYIVGKFLARNRNPKKEIYYQVRAPLCVLFDRHVLFVFFV